ncbi:hypothetical protein [Micromonospora haikouensis]|uniref:hypothetical protein n=1 Tax=Micromonospora haikouensis TaxID=686309 RepID=UPI00378736C7
MSVGVLVSAITIPLSVIDLTRDVPRADPAETVLNRDGAPERHSRFTEAGTLWRGGADGAVAALR